MNNLDYLLDQVRRAVKDAGSPPSFEQYKDKNAPSDPKRKRRSAKLRRGVELRKPSREKRKAAMIGKIVTLKDNFPLAEYAGKRCLIRYEAVGLESLSYKLRDLESGDSVPDSWGENYFRKVEEEGG